jgi:uncharacterized protein YgbK (DUF1537 family)
MARMIAIADDLTGAADCAAACAGHGIRAAVLLYTPQHEVAEKWPLYEILSIDTDTRALPAAQAIAATAEAMRLCHMQGVLGPGSLLFKKLDSTLRGNWAAELAAVLRACEQLTPDRATPRALLAPALPAQGRTTVDGRQRVHGRPLEETEFWDKDPRSSDAGIAAMLMETGLSSRLANLATVRADENSLRQAMEKLTREADVLVCDAETDDDLRRIAEASIGLEGRTVWAGSAGLAWHLPQAAGLAATCAQTEPIEFTPGPTLFVVGTRAAASCRQAGILAAAPDVLTLRVSPRALLGCQVDSAAIVAGLQSGRDMLVWVDETERCPAHEAALLPRQIAKLVAPGAALFGGLVATGGETARAIFDELGIRRLRLLGEVEPGLPFSIAEGWTRPVPVLTKAGGFGSPEALVRCREFLQTLQRGSAHHDPRPPVC